MIIGVMSDTHGFLTEMRKVAHKMLDELGCETIVHLGDDSTDADELRSIGADIIAVPGVFEDRYADPNFSNRIITEFMGIPFLLTHTPTADAHDLPNDINPTEAAQDGDAKVVLHGHTHLPDVVERYGAIYVNPGHIKMDDKRGSKPSFAVLNVAPPKLNVRILSLDGEEIINKTFFVEL